MTPNRAYRGKALSIPRAVATLNDETLRSTVRSSVHAVGWDRTWKELGDSLAGLYRDQWFGARRALLKMFGLYAFRGYDNDIFGLVDEMPDFKEYDAVVEDLKNCLLFEVSEQLVGGGCAALFSSAELVAVGGTLLVPYVEGGNNMQSILGQLRLASPSEAEIRAVVRQHSRSMASKQFTSLVESIVTVICMAVGYEKHLRALADAGLFHPVSVMYQHNRWHSLDESAKRELKAELEFVGHVPYHEFEELVVPSVLRLLLRAGAASVSQ